MQVNRYMKQQSVNFKRKRAQLQLNHSSKEPIRWLLKMNKQIMYKTNGCFLHLSHMTYRAFHMGKHVKDYWSGTQLKHYTIYRWPKETEQTYCLQSRKAVCNLEHSRIQNNFNC